MGVLGFLCVYACLSFAVYPVALSAISAPTNVTVTCHNFKNVVYWNYSGSDHPEFNIEIRVYGGDTKSVRTSQTYLDISEYTLEANNVFYVTVDAQLQESKPDEGISFSYYENFETDIKCVVDFPELNVSVLPHSVELSFKHPYYVHKVDSLEYEFLYTISYNETDSQYGCLVEDDVCTQDLHLFNSLYKSCVDIHIAGTVDDIPLEITKNVCSHVAPVKTDWLVILTALVCSVLGLGVLIILGAMICRKLTKPDSHSTIFSKILGKVNSGHVINVPEQPTLSEVTSVGHTPLLNNTDLDFTSLSSPVVEEQTHFPISFTSVSSTDEQDHGEADLESSNSGISFSGYDRQKFPIDMGQGDVVEAYGPR